MKCQIYRCMSCISNYDAIPCDYISEDRVINGLCSTKCLHQYLKLVGISERQCQKRYGKYIKDIGLHNLGDFILTGDLEKLLEEGDVYGDSD